MKTHLSTIRNAVLAIAFVFGLVVTVQNHYAQRRLDSWLKKHADIRPFLGMSGLQKLKFLSTEDDFETKADAYLASLQRMWQAELELEISRKRQQSDAKAAAADKSFFAGEKRREVPESGMSYPLRGLSDPDQERRNVLEPWKKPLPQINSNLDGTGTLIKN